MQELSHSRFHVVHKTRLQRREVLAHHVGNRRALCLIFRIVLREAAADVDVGVFQLGADIFIAVEHLIEDQVSALRQLVFIYAEVPGVHSFILEVFIEVDIETVFIQLIIHILAAALHQMVQIFVHHQFLKNQHAALGILGTADDGGAVLGRVAGPHRAGLFAVGDVFGFPIGMPGGEVIHVGDVFVGILAGHDGGGQAVFRGHCYRKAQTWTSSPHPPTSSSACSRR